MQNSYYYFCFKVNGCSATTWINGKLKLLHLFESVTASLDRYVAAVVVADVVVVVDVDVVIVVDVVDVALLSTRQTSTS